LYDPLLRENLLQTAKQLQKSKDANLDAARALAASISVGPFKGKIL
jgi:hypothetical protein